MGSMHLALFLHMFLSFALVWQGLCTQGLCTGIGNATLTPEFSLQTSMMVPTRGKSLTSPTQDSNSVGIGNDITEEQTTVEHASATTKSQAKVSVSTPPYVVKSTTSTTKVTSSTTEPRNTSSTTTTKSTPATKPVITIGGLSVNIGCGTSPRSCPQTCGHREEVSNQSSSLLHCRCDPTCLKFGDCCPSYITQCTNLNDPLDPLETIGSSPSDPETEGMYDLLNVYGECVSVSLPDRYLVVGYCPADYENNTVASHCQNSSSEFSDLVLSVSPELYVMFKNKHCAACHSVSLEQQVSLVELSLCPKQADIGKGDSSQVPRSCEIYRNRPPSLSPYSIFRPCTTSWPYADAEVDAMLSSPYCTSVEKRLCMAYLFPVWGTWGVRVRNPHCFRCFSEEKRESFFPVCVAQSSGRTPLGLQALFDLEATSASGSSPAVDTGSRYVRCGADAVFDDSVKVCRKLVCPDGRVATWGECVENKTGIVEASTQPFPQGTSTFLVFFPRIVDKIFVDYCSKVLYGQSATFSGQGNFFDVCSNHPKQQPVTFMSSNATIDARAFIDESRACLVCNESSLVDAGYKTLVAVKLKVSLFKNFTEALQSLKEHSPAVLEVSNMCHHVTGIIQSEMACNRTQLRAYENVTIRIIASVIYGEVSESNVTRLYPLTNIMFDLLMTSAENDTAVLLRRMVVCDEDPDAAGLSCPAVVYNRSEVVLLDNLYIQIRNTDIVYAPHEYEARGDDTILACSRFKNVDNLSASPWFFQFDDVLFYLSVVCSGLSMTCLTLSLASHALLWNETQNTGSRLTAALALFLLTGQCLLYVRLDCRTACFIVAVVTHFNWLSVFGWMTTISCNMAATFFSGSARTAPTSRALCVLALGGPAGVVVTCLVLDLLRPAGFGIGYGEGVCFWIGRRNALLGFFYAPVGLSMMANLVCFVLTICGIERTATVTKRLKERQQERQRCLVYLKVFLTIGVTWTLGFVAGATASPRAWYVFAVCNGLQGVSLFVCYTLSSRNRAQLRKRLSLSPRPASKTSSSISLSVTNL